MLTNSTFVYMVLIVYTNIVLRVLYYFNVSRETLIALTVVLRTYIMMTKLNFYDVINMIYKYITHTSEPLKAIFIGFAEILSLISTF